MFGRSSNVIVDSYSSRRSRKGLPGWVWVLLIGVALGIGAVIGVQERLLPPRLSTAESTRLTEAFDVADRERTRLRAELVASQQKLQQSTQDALTQGGSAAAAQRRVAELQGDVAALVDALPLDPRGGVVQVRAARFRAEGGQLFYDIVLSRERSSDKPWNGVLHLVLTGSAAGSDAATLRLEPIALAMGRYASLRGSRSLPARFDVRQAGVQVLDRAQGQVLGARVFNLK